MPKDANFFVAQIAGVLVLNCGHAQAQVDDLIEQVQALTAERDALKKQLLTVPDPPLEPPV